MRLILIRHGESEANARGIIQGRKDYGLTDLGREQARRVAARLAAGDRPVRLLSSPLLRARQTADIVAAALGLPVEEEPGLLEYDVGAISGLTGPEVRERFPDVVAAFRRGERPRFPGEEGREAFWVRVGAVLEAVQHRGEHVVAVAHGGVISAACAMIAGLEPGRLGQFEAANCAITEIGVDRGGRRVIVRQNDTCHLAGIVTAADRG
jgi:broad specificity phosphatase PhoE